MMASQPNKPGVDEEPEPAVRNQGEARPEDYPDKAEGSKAIGGDGTG